MIGRISYQIAPALGALGILLLLASGGIWVVTSDADRWVIVLVAGGLGLTTFFALERSNQVVAFLAARHFRYGTNTAAMALLAVAIVILLNILANRYVLRIDMTANQMYSLSEQTVGILRQLEHPVHMIGFQREGSQTHERSEDLLKEYRRHSSLVSYEFVDPTFKPGLARQYGIEQFDTTVVEAGDRRELLFGAEEGDLSSAILKLSRSEQKRIYWLSGHGELDPSNTGQLGASEAKRLVESSNFEVIPLNLASTGTVPAQADLLILAGPNAGLLEAEQGALVDYIRSGGRVLLLLEPGRLDHVRFLLDELGIHSRTGVVIDPSQSLLNDPYSPIITNYNFSPVTKNLPMVLMQTGAEIAPTDRPESAYAVSSLAETTTEAWLETNPRELRFDPDEDVAGPLTVVASVVTRQTGDEGTSEGNSAHVIVIADADLMTNGMIGLAGNRDLLLNAVNWLGEEEGLLGLRSKQTQPAPLVISNTQVNFIFLLSVLVMPAAVLVVGATVAWRRR